MKILITSLLLTLPIICIAQDYNRWGEKFFDRLDKDIIAVEHKETVRDGHTTYSIYFPITLLEKDVFEIAYERELLYLEYSHFKLTVIVRETKPRKVKKILRHFAWVIMQSAKNQVYYKSIKDNPDEKEYRRKERANTRLYR